MPQGIELELDTASEESRDVRSPELTVVETDVVDGSKPATGSTAHVSRRYTPSDTWQLEHDFKVPHRKGLYRKLVDSFQLSRQPGFARSNASVDLLVTFFCFATVHFAYLGNLDFTSQRTVALFSSLVFMILALSAGGMYSTKRLRTINRELTNLVLCWMCAFAAIGLFAFLSKTAAEVSRVWITASMLLTLASLIGARILGCIGFIAVNKVKARNVVICGNTANIKPVMNSLYDVASAGVRVAKIFEFSTDKPATVTRRSSAAAESPARQIIKYVENQRQSGDAIEQVWIAVPAHQSQIVDDLSQTLINSSVDVCVVPDTYTDRLLKGGITRYGDSKIVNISEISLSPAADQFKRVFDVCLSLVALLFLSIPMAIVACLIKLETPGPVLFRQNRYGVDGRVIEVLKFRSMCVHSDSQATQATRNDARITRVGRIIRKTSLDELPQLINVLRGTMSLVGPRPHAVAHNEMWRSQIQGYMLRHKVRPGITGWAQVNGWRGETDKAFKMQQRVKYDLEYIQNWSPWLDIKIIILTVFKGFINENAY